MFRYEGEKSESEFLGQVLSPSLVGYIYSMDSVFWLLASAYTCRYIVLSKFLIIHAPESSGYTKHHRCINYRLSCRYFIELHLP